jgi:lysozyme family protein
LIAAIHYRESGMDFSTYLHNGEKLGKVTEKVPRGKFFEKNQWAEAAIDAIQIKAKTRNSLGITKDTTDPALLLTYAETYNGLGYRVAGRGPSPYIYAGTNIFMGGMYERDGQYNPNKFDPRIGVAACLKILQ